MAGVEALAPAQTASMQRLSPLDASFLHLERDVQQLNVGSALVFEGPAPTHAEVCRAIEALLPAVPALPPARARRAARPGAADLGRRPAVPAARLTSATAGCAHPGRTTRCAAGRTPHLPTARPRPSPLAHLARDGTAGRTLRPRQHQPPRDDRRHLRERHHQRPAHRPRPRRRPGTPPRRHRGRPRPSRPRPGLRWTPWSRPPRARSGRSTGWPGRCGPKPFRPAWPRSSGWPTWASSSRTSSSGSTARSAPAGTGGGCAPTSTRSRR